MKTLLTTVCFTGIRACVLLSILFLSLSAGAATVMSVQDGAFRDPDTWDSGQIPTAVDSVVIYSEHTVFVDSNHTVKSVCVYNNVDFTQTLFTVNATYTLTLTGHLRIHSDGASEEEEPTARVNLRGILKVNKNIYLTSFDGVFNTAVATMKFLYANGTLELGGTIVNEGGGGFIDASTAITTLKLTGSTSQTLDVTGDIEFFNLTIDKTGGATVTLDGENLNTSNMLGNFSLDNGRFDANGFTMTGNNTKNFTVKTGTTLVLNGTSMPTGYTIALNSGSTVEYRGTATVTSRTYQNLTIAGSGTRTLGGAVTVSGNLLLSGGTLDVSSANNYVLNVAGSWLNTGGTFQARNGTVTFNGTTDQSVTSNGNNFYNVTINNTGTEVSLNDNITVGNLLTLTDGVITTGATYRVILTSTTAANLAGFTSASFVNGNLRRNIASNTSTYAFPVGNGTGTSNYFRTNIVNGNLTGITYIDVRFKALTNHVDDDMDVMDDWGTGSLTYTTMNTAGVWEITPNASPSGGTYDITLYTGNMAGLNDNEFGPLKRPTGSLTAAAWSTGDGTLNNHNGDGRKVADGYAIRRGLTGFSEFGVGGGTQAGHGLPIKLLSFIATEMNGRVDLKWATATEVNNDYFTIERSQDGESFEIMNTFQGSGNTSVTTRYQAVDHHPYAGVSYYRLKQTDYDGAYTYSDVVSVAIRQDIVKHAVAVIANPVVNKTITLNIPQESVEGISMPFALLADMSGKNVFTQTNLALASDGTSSIELPRSLAPGFYFFTLFNGKTTFRSKLFVE